MTAETWTTTVVTVDTPRGPRYQGVSHVGEGMPRFGKLPRNAQVRYTTRLHRSANEAREQARSRTIHHNVFHADSRPPAADAAVNHRGIRWGTHCLERNA